jgi:hypothetical protein
MGKLPLLALAGACVFGVVAAVMIKVMPGPLKDSDYLIIGSVATVVTLLVLFLVIVSTKLKASDVFFTRRKKKRP